MASPRPAAPRVGPISRPFSRSVNQSAMPPASNATAGVPSAPPSSPTRPKGSAQRLGTAMIDVSRSN